MTPRWTEDLVKDTLANPIYAGIPPYPAIVDEEVWIEAAIVGIKEMGAEEFLTRMLHALRDSMEAWHDGDN